MYISTRSLAFALAIAAHSAAQTSTSTTSSAAPSGSAAITPATSVNATIYPGDSTYTYYGCYNETTLINGTAGLRALSGGADETSDSMTVETCLKFCQSNGGGAFAGLEYTKECYCAAYLSALSSKLPDSSCNLACEGNTTQICGGALTLTVYQKSSTKKGAAVSDKRPVVGSILALGVAVGVLVGWS